MSAHQEYHCQVCNYYWEVQDYKGCPICDNNHTTESKNMTETQTEFAFMKDIERRFTYHAPKKDQPERYVAIREQAKQFAELIIANTPKSREQSIALTRLEEVVFWSNASIARNE